eukprot:CAMPEP_0185725286 /NCGR_PEP_ID=MMETSP1171-20130828/1580_1 /TAXON_ID=374046 /ORGANISM="Helicotheca tamensis, Strain CCMP826" /LENGTH=402 /DNA_ID=CAMNT_0028393371 /DNA_START=84 /DNA_END=1292 /DNA_ORIENTATION=+
MFKSKNHESLITLIALITMLCFVADNEYILNYWHPSQRRMSLDLGNGRCQWTPPDEKALEGKTFFKTIIAGFPSGDKRLTFVQLEALTGLPAKDEWDFEFLGMSNHPFIKANYPHHEGIWGWQDAADQVIMVVRNIKRAMVEYHDILWDIDYAKTWEDAFKLIPNLYQERPPVDDFLAWRDERVFDEIKWYGWFIDYYMEGGLMRDMFTNKITTPEHWNMLMLPTAYTIEQLRYDTVVGNDTVVDPSYDPNCALITNGCVPVKIISAEKLVDHELGPAVGLEIADVVDGKQGMNVIAPEARGCIWKELIINKKGLKTFIDRYGDEDDYNFTRGHLESMVGELDRLIDKYGGNEWNQKKNALDLVALLEEHRGLLNDDLAAGRFRRMMKRSSSALPERFGSEK